MAGMGEEVSPTHCVSENGWQTNFGRIDHSCGCSGMAETRCPPKARYEGSSSHRAGEVVYS